MTPLQRRSKGRILSQPNLDSGIHGLIVENGFLSTDGDKAGRFLGKGEGCKWIHKDVKGMLRVRDFLFGRRWKTGPAIQMAGRASPMVRFIGANGSVLQQGLRPLSTGTRLRIGETHAILGHKQRRRSDCGRVKWLADSSGRVRDF